MEACGAVAVLFLLSWRLAPVCSIVIVATAVAAAVYRKFTRGIEANQSKALGRMIGVALQALENMRTVRWVTPASHHGLPEGPPASSH
jgi:ATP-binding cassette subfamily B (MDR/TAP) protein 10